MLCPICRVMVFNAVYRPIIVNCDNDTHLDSKIQLKQDIKCIKG